MKTLIAYSTISGNTKAVCEKIYEALNIEKEIVNIKDIKNITIDDFENIILGFWCDKGTMDKNSLEFLANLKNKNLYFLGTLGARPESDHWKSVEENAIKLCSENNNLAGFPKNIKIKVETTINPIINKFSYFSTTLNKVFKKDTLV